VSDRVGEPSCSVIAVITTLSCSVPVVAPFGKVQGPSLKPGEAPVLALGFNVGPIGAGELEDPVALPEVDALLVLGPVVPLGPPQPATIAATAAMTTTARRRSPAGTTASLGGTVAQQDLNLSA
jgi:hypothetical protein